MQTPQLAESRAKHRNAHTWTREQAAIAGERGRLAMSLRAKAKPQITAPLRPITRQPGFDELLLVHVRARVTELLNHLQLLCQNTKPDFTQVDRLASALERLAELERKLDGRPLPGSRRPAPEPSPRSSPRIAPPAARPARPTPAPPSPAADEDDDSPPMQSAPLD